MTEKIDVIGNNAHPFFNWAKDNHGKVQYLNGISIK
jgi:glutathione peroxidase-family protein